MCDLHKARVCFSSRQYLRESHTGYDDDAERGIAITKALYQMDLRSPTITIAKAYSSLGLLLNLTSLSLVLWLLVSVQACVMVKENKAARRRRLPHPQIGAQVSRIETFKG